MDKRIIYTSEEYDLYHKRDNIFVVWWKEMLVSIEAIEYNFEIEYFPYPFYNNNFPNREIEKHINKFLYNEQKL